MQVRTRAVTLPQHINSSSAIHLAALRLLRAEMPIEIRLMGLRMSNFLEILLEPGQRSISGFVHAALPAEPSNTHSAAEAASGEHAPTSSLKLACTCWS